MTTPRVEGEATTENLNPRIRTALTSVNPTTQHPAWHGAPTALGVLRGISPAAAVWRPYPGANNIREIALHIAFWENSVAEHTLYHTAQMEMLKKLFSASTP